MLPDIEFPAPLQCLFAPKRYKVLWGGRGAGRSWGVARALLLLGASKSIRVLCARELQNSIADSVHQVLEDQIKLLGLESKYIIQRDKIIGLNGTQFTFEGIKNNTTKIKSYEGIDYCWVEEANSVSKRSWGIIIPTIRKENSEIWITFNPELKTDYTYRRFVLEADPAESTVVKMTYADNPWFPDVLRREMEHDKKFDYDHYLNIWEGHCIEQLEGAVFGKELRKARLEGRICAVPWDREWPVETFWDLGRRDATSIWFAQRVAMQYRVLRHFSDNFEDITYYLRELQSLEYTYGTVWLPHDAKAKQLGSKRSIEEIVRQAGYRVQIVPKLSETDGINAARIIFPNCWFDAQNCEEGLEGLAHYKFRISGYNAQNKPVFSDKPEHSDIGDSFRYMGVALHGPRPRSSDGVISRLAGVISRTRAERERELTTHDSGRASTTNNWLGR